VGEKKTAVYIWHHMKLTNTFSTQSARFINVKCGGTCSNRWTL